MKFKPEDIAFWILILAAIFVILWLLRGSPTLESSIITIGLFIISSELMLWKKYFEVDKNTAVSFAKFKKDMSNLTKGQEEINNKLNNIQELIKKRRK